MTRNPICTEMNWPIPADGERLTITRDDGHRAAYLTPARDGTFEGVYLFDAGFGVPNSCFSAAYDRRPAAIRAGLAKKLYANARNLKKGELATLLERLPNCRVEIEKN